MIISSGATFEFSRLDFLSALFSQYFKSHKGFIVVQTVKPDGKSVIRYFPNIDLIAKEHYDETVDVYFSVYPRERMRSDISYIKYITALWINLDIEETGHTGFYFKSADEAAKRIRSFPMRPSIIVESGRGSHLYWLLSDVVEVKDYNYLVLIIERIYTEFGYPIGHFSLSTMARMPNTVNNKIPSHKVLCEVRFLNTNYRYTLEEFEKLGEKSASSSVESVEPVYDPNPTILFEGECDIDYVDLENEPTEEDLSPSEDDICMIIDKSYGQVEVKFTTNADVDYEDYEVNGEATLVSPLDMWEVRNVEDLCGRRVELVLERTLLQTEEVVIGTIIKIHINLIIIRTDGNEIYLIPISRVVYIKVIHEDVE